MASPEETSQTVPGTVFTPRQVRLLKWAVIIMGIMLVGGFALVMAAIVYQASHLGESTPAATSKVSAPAETGVLKLPEGMTISHMALGDNRLAVHLKGPQGEEIRIIDLGTGQVIRTLPLARE